MKFWRWNQDAVDGWVEMKFMPSTVNSLFWATQDEKPNWDGPRSKEIAVTP